MTTIVEACGHGVEVDRVNCQAAKSTSAQRSTSCRHRCVTTKNGGLSPAAFVSMDTRVKPGHDDLN